VLALSHCTTRAHAILYTYLALAAQFCTALYSIDEVLYMAAHRGYALGLPPCHTVLYIYSSTVLYRTIRMVKGCTVLYSTGLYRTA